MGTVVDGVAALFGVECDAFEFGGVDLVNAEDGVGGGVPLEQCSGFVAGEPEDGLVGWVGCKSGDVDVVRVEPCALGKLVGCVPSQVSCSDSGGSV